MFLKPNLGVKSTRRAKWPDLAFRVGLVLAIGYVLGHYLLPCYLSPPELTDHQKWLARPKLGPMPSNGLAKADEHNSIPCLFIFLSDAPDQSASSGSVADCLTLVPDGKKLDLLELNLGSGLLFPIETDLYVAGSVPLAFTRAYYPTDDWAQRFQVHLPHVYDPYLTGSRFPYTYSDWLLPDRQTIHFERISSGTGYADYVAGFKGFDSSFANSRIAWNGFGWDLALPDGSTYLSPEAYNATRPQQGSLTGILDKDGREVHLTRAQNGDLQEISSPSGDWIRLGYNALGQIAKAANNSGQFVDYVYDSTNRLQTVRYSNGRIVTYTYNPQNRISSIVDPSRSIQLSVEYDRSGMPSRLTLNHETIQFRYFLDQVDKARQRANAHVDILKPHGEVIRIRIAVTPDGLHWTAE